MIDYKLPQTELFCYAIIHSFSKQQQGCFFGTQGYLAEQIRTSRQGVNKALINLSNKGLIVKRIVSNRLEYTTTLQPPLTENENKTINRSCTFASTDLDYVQPRLTKDGATTVAGIATTVAPCATTVDKGATTVAQIIKDNKSKRNLLSKKESKKCGADFDSLVAGYTKNADLINALLEFIKMRVSIKKIPTNRALEILFAKLDRMAATEDERIRLLEQSILNNWQDVFPLKAPVPQTRGTSKSKSALEDLNEFLRSENE